MLLIDVPIQNRGQQLQIYEVFNLPVLHGYLSAQYIINHKYIGVTYDETKAVAIMDQQYTAWQHANCTVLQNKCTIPTTNPHHV